MRFTDPGALLTAAGTALGTTAWRSVSGDDVEHFAIAAPVPAWVKREALGPFGMAVVPGYLTLALATPFLADLLEVDGYGIGVDYGLDRVRFPVPVPVGSRVRAHGLLLSAHRHPQAIRAVVELRYECDAAISPTSVAQVVTLLLPSAADPGRSR